MLYAVASEAGEEFDRAQKTSARRAGVHVSEYGHRLQGVHKLLGFARANVNNTSAKLSGAFREVRNRRATHEAVCAEVKKASQRTADLKRKTTEAHEKTRSPRER